METATDPLADLRAALRVIRGARRVVVVPPHLEDAAQKAVQAAPLGHLFRVRTNQYLPRGLVCIVPETHPFYVVPETHPAPTGVAFDGCHCRDDTAPYCPVHD